MLKDGDRSTVVRLRRDDGDFVLKRYNRKGPVHTATHLLLRSRAAWCWRTGRRLEEVGLRTPRPLAYVERRLGALRFESWLLTPFVDGRTLLEVVQGDPSAEALARHAEDFGAIWRTLGALRAGHDDMKATNFIVDEAGRLWLIDLDGMRLGLRGAWFRRARRKDRARFMRNWQGHPRVAEAFRARLGTA